MDRPPHHRRFRPELEHGDIPDRPGARDGRPRRDRFRAPLRSLLRQTWGEQLISGIAFGWMGLLFAIPGVVLGVLGANGYPIFIVPAVLWFATMVAAFTAAREIFTVVLYRYATTGEPPNGYDAATLGTALRRR